ncbi:MAG TPA: helix-turn-helix transcriptional regulator [Longimicrobium sp.]|nr:helix-turn-helix transcriptional regulator [Longimicrobium sp.]
MPHTSPPAIGPVLRSLRQQRGLSQEDLAAKAGMHRNYIGGIERGEKSPTINSVSRILAALGVTWTELGKALDGES